MVFFERNRGAEPGFQFLDNLYAGVSMNDPLEVAFRFFQRGVGKFTNYYPGSKVVRNTLARATSLKGLSSSKRNCRQGGCLSALQRLIKSSDERQRVNWQSRQDLADEKVAAVKREEQKKMHALRRCMRSEQIVRFKGSPFSKAGVDNSREGIVKEIVFTRPRHDTKMPDYIAVELPLRRTAAVDTVASSSLPPPPPHSPTEA